MAEAAAPPLGSAGSLVTITVSPALSNFKIIPKDAEEEADTNMPKDMKAALLVLYNVDASKGERCKTVLDAYLQLLAAGPSGNNRISVGQAILCWNCGHVAIPANIDEMGEAPPEAIRKAMPPYAQCASCNEREQSNWLCFTQPDGETIVPWIQKLGGV